MAGSRRLDMSSPMSNPTGAELIQAERVRQQQVEGWTPEHDDEHSSSEMIMAALCYANIAGFMGNGHSAENAGNMVYPDWPWDMEHLKPSPDRVRNLVKAGALIAAEIDR